MQDWKVLLVDDEEDFVSTLAERLRMRGIQARTSGNGEEALRSIAADPPHVVVLDVMMPGMSGLDVLRKIKADFPGIEVILLTGIGSTREGVEGMRLGALDYLMKPLQIEELIEKLRDAVDKSTEAAHERA
ncbi:MAG: response regulator [Deltaproteobacteria bacterium]|nr:response regulator [Deltaproteobacteria bacterium]